MELIYESVTYRFDHRDTAGIFIYYVSFMVLDEMHVYGAYVHCGDKQLLHGSYHGALDEKIARMMLLFALKGPRGEMPAGFFYSNEKDQ